MKNVKLMLGDNMESLKKLPDNSIDIASTRIETYEEYRKLLK